MSTVLAQVLPVTDVCGGSSATILEDRSQVSGVATSAASSTALTLSGTVVSPPTSTVWRIGNIGAEAVIVLTYSGAHPNPASAAAALAAGGVLLAPNTIEMMAYNPARPNICVINA
jgi:hypothetical protein